jgi:hypothetical protein
MIFEGKPYLWGAHPCIRPDLRHAGIDAMKRALRIFAAIFVLVAAVYWLAAGANPGWTKTSLPVKTVDEVTGLDRIEWQQKFVPGVDFLAGIFLVSGGLAGLSLFFPYKKLGS